MAAVLGSVYDGVQLCVFIIRVEVSIQLAETRFHYFSLFDSCSCLFLAGLSQLPGKNTFDGGAEALIRVRVTIT